MACQPKRRSREGGLPAVAAAPARLRPWAEFTIGPAIWPDPLGGQPCAASQRRLVGEAGLEPAKAKPADLQSAPFAARDIPPLALEPHGISGKLQAPGEKPAGGLRAGVMVTPLRSVNRKRF